MLNFFAMRNGIRTTPGTSVMLQLLLVTLFDLKKCLGKHDNIRRTVYTQTGILNEIFINESK